MNLPFFGVANRKNANDLLEECHGRLCC
jgi:hypothetical protein